jgi:hypothetical protein
VAGITANKIAAKKIIFFAFEAGIFDPDYFLLIARVAQHGRLG